MLWLLVFGLLLGNCCCSLSSSTPKIPINRCCLDHVTVLITAPPSYAPRLQVLLEAAGATVVACPTVVTEFFPEEDDDQDYQLLCQIFRNDVSSSQHDQEEVKVIHDESTKSHTRERIIPSFVSEYDYVAFTSRRGIQAALRVGGSSLVQSFQRRKPIAIALGVDAEELVLAGVDASALLIPEDPTPDGIVQLITCLRNAWREDPQLSTHDSPHQPSQQPLLRILCPVPKVVGVTEPSVVPQFLSKLGAVTGCHVDRLGAYITRWTGPSPSGERAIQMLRDGLINVIGVSSTAEVEGLRLLCQEYNLEWETLTMIPTTTTTTTATTTRSRTSTHPDGTIQVVAHGPVTASGARALGLPVHAISKNSSSFAGMVGAVSECISSPKEE
jgi:uroporphyrinogen-III synthase